MKIIFILLGILPIFNLKLNAQINVEELTPLTELGTNTFNGFVGGLYPNGSNQMPNAFFQDAVLQAKSIVPLDESGNPSNNGKIGLVTIGASTVAMFSEGIERQLENVNGLRKEIIFVNGGIGGQDLNKIYDQNAKYWITVSSRVAAAGLSNNQVQIVWFQEDDLKNTTSAFPDRADLLVESFTYAIQKLKERYPNLKFVYLTARHTTEYMPVDAKDKHREPRAYYNGWATKFLIEKQINGDTQLNYKGASAVAPMIIWGPYFWTQGEKTRADGYAYPSSLSSNDGVHPNEAGKIKVGQDLLSFWQMDAVSQLWFLDKPSEIIASDNQIDFIQFKILNTLMEEIPRAGLAEQLQIILLKDSVVIYDKNFALNQVSINISNLDADTYKYIIKDNGKYIKVGGFSIDEDTSIQKFQLTENQETKEDAVVDPTINSSKAKNLVSEDEPAWFINSNNKLPKLLRFMPGESIVKAEFKDMSGNVVLVVEDVFHKHTNVNNLLESAEYDLTFYNTDGEIIVMGDRPVPERIRIKN